MYKRQTYNKAEFDFYFDDIDRKALNTYANQEAAIFEVWAGAIAEIIMAPTKEEQKALYDAALAKSYEEGAAEWLETGNTYFKRYKESRGVEFAYPKNRSDYIAPEVRLLGGLYETIFRPEYVYEVLPNE